MSEARIKFEDLQSRIGAKAAELRDLQSQLNQLKASANSGLENRASQHEAHSQQHTLHLDEFKRYGRQMILPEIGLPNQLKLRNASVLIIGLGGLGCPAAAYLAGAGVGTLGLVDGDTVEISNLHRQILHSTRTVGKFKVHSAAEYIEQLNPEVRCRAYRAHLEPGSALDIFADYDLVLDCTDHPTSRYLISDAAVCSGIPLVSAAALKTDGQLLVLNYPPFSAAGAPSGPCYRCVNPMPPPVETVLSCGEGGILGPVVGTMGVLMATEAIKIVTSSHFPFGKTPEASAPEMEPPQAGMLIYSALSATPFRSIKIKGRRADCPACSSSPQHRSITADTLTANSLDYAAFCGINNPPNILQASQRVTPAKLKGMTQSGEQDAEGSGALVLDVRDATQFGICHLPHSVNLPINDLEAADYSLAGVDIGRADRPVVVVCRVGNDSQLAVKGIRERGTLPTEQPVLDLQGGLQAWRQQVDPHFPDY